MNQRLRGLSGALGRKLLLSILAFSFMITLITSCVVLYSDYQEEVEAQNADLKQLEGGYLESIALSLWAFDSNQIDSQLRGIINFPHVVFVRVTASGISATKGSLSSSTLTKNYSYDLIHLEADESHHVGVLEVVVDQEKIYMTLYKKAVVIVITQFFKTTIVSLFILFLMYTLVTRHLTDMAAWARNLRIHDELILNRVPNIKDEIGDVADAINQLRLSIISGQKLTEDAQKQLEVANKELESRVNERTKDLLSAIDRLNTTIEELKATQSKLVEAEKMASLGQMVAGIAHELNTPIGICITAQSHLIEKIDDIKEKQKNNTLTRDDFDDYLTLSREGLDMLSVNLNRSSALVASFKQLAVDRKDQVVSRFNISRLIKVVEEELMLELGENHIDIQLMFADDVEVETFADPLKKVLEHLIRNSMEHGFKDSKGSIYISIINGEDRLYIDYRDDGEGIPENIREHIFDPFVTTERKRGQAGLGLHLVYNLVTQVLGGSISYVDSKMGAHFSIEISKDIHDKDVIEQGSINAGAIESTISEENGRQESDERSSEV